MRVACRGFDRRSLSSPWGSFFMGWKNYKMRGRAVSPVCQKCIPFAGFTGVISFELRGLLFVGKSMIIPVTFCKIYIKLGKGIHAPVWLRCEIIFSMRIVSFSLAFRFRTHIWLIIFILRRKLLLCKLLIERYFFSFMFHKNMSIDKLCVEFCAY